MEIKKLGWGFGRCNQRCKHCYNASKSQGPAYTFAQLRAVADKVCPGITDINYGTGEFFVNPNSVDLCEYIADTYPYISQAVTSNGSTIVMMRPEKIRSLFHDVDVSLDFPDERRHCEFRVHPKAWTWVIEALEILRDQNVPRSIVTCVNSQTTDSDIAGLLELAKKYDATWRINWFRCTGRGTEDLRIDAKRAWDIIRFLSDKVVFQCVDSIFAGPLSLSAKPCPAGHHTCRIHENMETSCYPFLKGEEWSGGNMLDPKVTLETIYNSLAFSRLRERKVSFCQECPFKDICGGGCVTRASLHSGGINMPDDYCPILAGLDVTELSKINVRQEKSKNLVHDGYLCTTIVKPY